MSTLWKKRNNPYHEEDEKTKIEGARNCPLCKIYPTTLLYVRCTQSGKVTNSGRVSLGTNSIILSII